MKEQQKKFRSETKIQNAREKRAKLAKKFKNKPEPINIKSATTGDLKEEYQKLSKREISKPGKDIKNKQKRQEIILQRAQRKKQIKSKIRRNKDDTTEKFQKTIDNQREHDETYIEGDEEIVDEELNDELADYFKGEYDPQIMITTGKHYTSLVFKFIKSLKETIPNMYFYYRKKMDIGQMINYAKEKGFSTLIVVHEETKKISRMSICHLHGEGLTVELKVNDIIYREEIKGSACPSTHNPELVFKNFKTKLGFRVQRILNSMFPKDEQLEGRRVISFHNQRDYIYFRHYRYQFEDDLEGVRLQEIGPAFYMKLLSIQKGFFDRNSGDFEFNYKDRMGVRRRKFYL